MLTTRTRPPLILDIGHERVATHAELVGGGIPLSTVMYRISPEGRWQRLLPGIVLMHSGRPTARERLIGALAYAGDDAVLTGMSALTLYGLRTADAGPVHVLVPHDRRRQNQGFVVVERTRQLPTQEVQTVRGLPAAPLARAVVDACRRMDDLSGVRNLVADAVQNHSLTLPLLSAAMYSAARQRTAPMRRVVAEIGVGVRFAAEAKAREVILASGLPEPLYNVELLDGAGLVITVPDGYYPEWVCGYQIDSRRWHLSPQEYERTVASRAYAGRFGILLVAITPQRVFDDPEAFIADLSGAIEIARHRRPPVVAHRPRAGR